MENTIITIGRQYGSGGSEIGKKLAKKLDFEFYDSKLISLAAEKTNLHENYAKVYDEVPTNSFLYALTQGNNPYYFDISDNDKVFFAQSDVIENLARTRSCVIMGRCANYVLHKVKIPCISIFIAAKMEDKIQRISERENLSQQKAAIKIKKIEKVRKSYYSYYSDMEWGMPENYDMCFNSSSIAIDDIVDYIIEYINKFNK